MVSQLIETFVQHFKGNNGKCFLGSNNIPSIEYSIL